MLKGNKRHPVFEFDPSFVEEAVFLTIASKNDKNLDVQSFHREREKLYQDNCAKDRDAAFERLYEKYFDQVGLKSFFTQLVGDFPLLHQTNISLFVKRVWSKKEEVAQLYIQDDFKTVYIALMARRVLEPDFLSGFLRHELLRVSDMLDPQFQYTPDIDLNGNDELEDNLIRDRFRIIWDMYIDARLRKKGFSTVTPVDAQKEEFRSAFFFFSEIEQQNILLKLKGCDNLVHIDLVRWAQGIHSINSLEVKA